MKNDVENFGPSRETFIFVALSAGPFALTIVPWLHGHQPTRDLWFGIAIFAFGLYSIFAFKISLSQKGLRYRSPLSRHPIVEWSSIIRVQTGVKFQRGAYPPYFMKIHITGENQPLVINIKFFRKKALVRVATLIYERSPQAELDAGTKRLATGTLPSILRRSSA
jgi:hypothetical protein